MRLNTLKNLNKKGFTVIELLVAMAILGVLVFLATPGIMRYKQKSTSLVMMANMTQIRNASRLYYMDHRDWPILTDVPYTTEQINNLSKTIYDKTGQIANLDQDGSYYDIDYAKLKTYLERPKDGVNYVLQVPVGDIFYLGEPTDLGEIRIDKVINQEGKTNTASTKMNIATKQLIAGYAHGIVLHDDGNVWVWGENNDGRLGLGNNINQPIPVKLNLSNIKQLATGDDFSIAVRTDGTVWTWGDNSYGQLGKGDTNDRNLPAKVNIDNVIQVIAGAHSSYALKSDGTVWAWGYNLTGELGINSNENKYVPYQVNITNVKEIESGGYHAIAIKDDNTVWGWGNNLYGQLGLDDNINRIAPTQLNVDNVNSIETGYYHTIVLKNDGTVWTTGYNAYGQLGLGDFTNKNILTKVNIDNISQISGGTLSTMLINTNKDLFGAGYNDNLQYGKGDEKQSTFIQLDIANVKSVDSGGQHFYVMKEDGTIWSAGDNNFGQLGLGDLLSKTTLTEIAFNSIINPKQSEIQPPPSTVPTVPIAPTNLVASDGNTQINLTWNSVVGATYYNVYVSSDNVNYSLISTASTVTNSFYNVIGLTNGMLYYFKTSAVNAIGESLNSNVMSKTPSVQSSPINLGTAGNYTILTKTGISTVPYSVIVGNIAVSPIDATAITGFSLSADASNEFSRSTQVSGNIYAANFTYPTPSILTTAVSDMETAYNDAAGRSANYTEAYDGDISGKTLTPGVYKWSTGILINLDVTLAGDSNDVWVFEIAKGITQASATNIILTGGAQAKNIIWQSAESVSIGANAHFEGIILAKTNITMGANASINGRLLAQTAVTLIKNKVVAP